MNPWECPYNGTEPKENVFKDFLSEGASLNIYFDTSSWNYLAKHQERETLIHLIQRSNYRILASVISVSEVLRIKDELLRQNVCSTMRSLHGDGPLLERSYNELALAAAQGILQEQEDFVLPESEAGKYLKACMLNPTTPPTDEICKWQSNLEGNKDQFIQAIRPSQPDLTNQYFSPDVLDRDDFLEMLCELPSAKELEVSVPQMRIICQRSDVWKALAATLAYIITLSATHASKNKKSRRCPGARDLWQAPYLGVVEVFVTDDSLMLEAVSHISTLLQNPRPVVSFENFLKGLQTR